MLGASQRPFWARRTLRDVAAIGHQKGAELGVTRPDRRAGFRHVGDGGGVLHEHALGATAGYRPVDRDRFTRPRLPARPAPGRLGGPHDELDRAGSHLHRDRARDSAAWPAAVVGGMVYGVLAYVATFWVLLRGVLSSTSASFLSANPEWSWVAAHLMFGVVLGALAAYGPVRSLYGQTARLSSPA